MPSVFQHLIVGDGTIGLGVADALRRRGLACTLASRSGPKPPAAQGAATAHPRQRLDALDATALHRAAKGISHLYLTLGLPYNGALWQRDWPRVMQNAIDAALANRAVLVYFDNLYAYGPAPLQNPITEDHPTQPPSRKGLLRLALQRMLQDAGHQRGLRWVLGRSADFYGPGVRKSLLYGSAIERQLQGKTAQWLGNADARHSFTYALDAAEGLVMLALDEGAWQQSWHLPTAQPALTPRQWLALSAQRLHMPTAVQTLSPPAVWALQWFVPILREYREMLYQNTADYVFSSARFMQRYPRFRVTHPTDGVAAMVDSFTIAA